MVHSQLEQTVISRRSLQPLTPIQKTALFACFRFLIFHPFFQEGSADPICPYTEGEVRSHNLCSRQDRHFVGITLLNLWR